MPSRISQIAQVGKRRIELSNLKKVLYPDDHIIKAQLIEYYFKIAPTILAQVRGRPLSLVRYPDGITGESFFQKNRPDWAPAWIEHVTLGEEKKDYVIATEEASLVWLANLACIELHQMHSRAPHFDKPDYVVYDLDPPENFKFTHVAELALEFKEHLESFGYRSFVKTTGRKGLHVLAPIEPKWEFEKAFEAAKAVAQPFVDSHASSMTLHIKKEYRKGKVLLDIYRNRQSQTIVAAYSVRGLPGAPVSTPLNWEELKSLENPKVFNLHNVPQRVTESGDPWEAIGAYATTIHTEKKGTKVSPARRHPGYERGIDTLSSQGTSGERAGERGGSDRSPSSPRRSPLSTGGESARTYKTPEQLENYSRKRRFEKTPEPPPAERIGAGSAFVVHRHHASRLHYDLRLEQNGVLKSWAVPKGLPPRPGIMRLAVKVEDHPLEYVHFEGAIPKGEYGGGMMWKFAQGRYEITKEKKNGFYFRLQSRELNAEYRAHRTRENQWLLERVDNPQTDWLQDPIEPMLARTAHKPPDSEDYVYEVKWDGIRAMISVDEGEIRIHGRNRMDITKQFPELLIPEQAFRATSALFDGEIVCLDADGKPDFRNVIQRMQQKTGGGIERAKAKHPAVCYVFDCLYLDGRAVVNEPLTRRREWLQDAIKKDSAYRVSEFVEEGAPFFEAVKQMGLEGIMAKQRHSTYLPGKRSESWLKIKTRQTLECAIIGYTRGKGDRETSFGALHLAQAQDDELKYLGKVGAGFDDHSLEAVSAELEKLRTIKRPIKEKPLDDARSIWVESKLMCEVQFASLTKDGMLREPVFVRLRPDLSF
jgi:DNA ligase D-like protein (predicted ligase)/DNA ligase D-like protein (predicted polymerase)/DNA ligase D-like protein (predicted 3'-phosphoesterase)